MKKLVLICLFLSSIVGTSCVSASQQGLQKQQETTPRTPASTTKPSETAVNQPSTYPNPLPASESSNQSANGAYPVSTEEQADETLSTALPQTPTVHVDVILRATDPTQFVLNSGKYQLVEFFAFWCPTCKSMAPVLKNLENKYRSKVQFIYLDIDDPKTNPFKQALGYQYQPHLFLIDGEGKVLQQWVGYVTEEELDVILNSVPD
jgi:thiol-disulfide isomerase/thioredoxin